MRLEYFPLNIAIVLKPFPVLSNNLIEKKLSFFFWVGDLVNEREVLFFYEMILRLIDSYGLLK